MAESTEIINAALGHLGSAPIMQLTDASPAARYAKLWYRPTLMKLLREHNWSFAATRATLQPEVVTFIIDPYLYAFRKPSDCLRLTEVPDSEYRVERDHVLANVSPLSLHYIRLVDAAEEMDAAFRQTFQYALAEAMAMPLTGDGQKVQMLHQLLQGSITEARHVNAIEQKQPRMQRDHSWITCRYW